MSAKQYRRGSDLIRRQIDEDIAASKLPRLEHWQNRVSILEDELNEARNKINYQREHIDEAEQALGAARLDLDNATRQLGAYREICRAQREQLQRTQDAHERASRLLRLLGPDKVNELRELDRMHDK